ncbi:MAG: YncE family protein [bacterium]
MLQNSSKINLLIIGSLIFSIALMTFGCSSQQRSLEQRSKIAASRRQTSPTDGQIVIYARAESQEIPTFSLSIRKVVLNREDGRQQEVSGGKVNLRSQELIRQQKLLLVTDVPEGSYTGLTLFVESLDEAEEGFQTRLITVEHPISVIAGNSKSIFLVISKPESGESLQRQHVKFAVEDEQPESLERLVYVANQGSSNISVVSKRLGRVVYNILVGTQPYSIAADNRRNRLYIADRKEGVIYELDMNTQHLVKATQLGFTDEPVHVLPIPHRDLVALVNYGSDKIYLLDAFTLEITRTISVGDGPVDAVYSASYDRLFVLNQRFGTMSVIDLSSESEEPDTTISLEMEPTAIAIDENLDWLYITSDGSTNLMVMRISNLGVEKTITVGLGASCIAFDPYGRRIYIGSKAAQEIICVDPYTGVIVYTVQLPASPDRLLFDIDERRLYATVGELDGVAVIDPMHRRIEKWIETGRKPRPLAFRL